MLRLGASLVLMMAPGSVLAQPTRSCHLPHELYMAVTLVLDLVAFRDRCGTASPETREAAHRLSEAVVAHAGRIMGPQTATLTRDEFERFIAGRARAYRDPVRGDMQVSCAADGTAMMPDALLAAQIDATAGRIAPLMAPGGRLAQPECAAPR